MKIGIIGLGYWGPNMVRNFLANSNVVSVVCCDLNPKRLESIKQRFPAVETVMDYKAILKNPSVVAVAIVTPVSTHFKLAKEALEAGKHVLVEKPMTESVKDAQILIDLAAKKNLTLMVDHTFIYTGAVRRIKEIVQTGELGDIFYFDSVRVNLGLFQHDVNVLWDLAPHDISVMDYIVGQKPVSVSAVGSSHFNSIEDMAYVTVNFEKNLLAHFHVNWLSPVKVRKILIGGSKKMIVYDDMEPSEKVKVYNKGVDVQSEEMVHRLLVQYRMGDMYSPQLDQTEALTLMCKDFIDSIISDKKPESDGAAGFNVVRILEAGQRSLKNGGALVAIE
jgi:predicted dehydrogenase